MRIDKIELIGFKSFAERTAFNFHSGITCIVGPNGCGKSNIVDAFRWVLGEQSAKSLRGERMEEVIFNGSVSKKPRGMAEVTIVVSGLNGSRQSTPDETEEDSSDTAYVTRRLYRSGDSEYILNKNQCRLRDIKDLFLDTGLEVKSYSILEQERISEILNSKPQERRFLIEEIAGVMKYNARKKEAIAKLESSRTNLQRINDIIIEVKKQINLLDRLAKKAERYKKLSSEIRSIELKIAKRDYETLKESFKNISSEYNALKEDASLKRAELSNIENQTEIKRFKLLEEEKALEQLRIQFQDMEREIAEFEKTVAVSKTDKDNLKEYLTKLFLQEEEFNAKKTEALAKQEELDVTEAELLSHMESQKELLREKTDIVKSLEDELMDNEESLEEKRRKLFRTSEELSNLKNELSRFQSSFEDLNHREVSSIKDVDNLRNVSTEADSSLRDVEMTILAKNNDLQLLNEKKNIFMNELSMNKNKIEELRETLSKLREELASFTSRLESLKEFVFDRPTREILSENPAIRLLASISDVFDVDAEYEKAIESALSEKINLFILSSFDDIEIAFSSLKGKEVGRTAFIPINPLMSGEEVNVPEGVIGRASRFVQTQEEFSDVAKRLFENTFIVKDLKTALHLTTAGHRLLFVTLDGQVVEPSGAVIGGEVKGIFKRKRDIKELESTIVDKKALIGRLQTELHSLQHLIESKKSDLQHIESAIVEREKEVSLLKMTAENQREEKDRIHRKLAYLSTEIEQIVKEKDSLKKLISVKEAEIQSADLKRIDTEEDSMSLQDEIAKKKSGLEMLRTEVTDIRLSITSLKEKIESSGKEKETVLKEIDEINQKKEFLSSEISSVETRISQRETEIGTYEEKIKSLISVADILKAEISAKKEIVEAENQELLTTEQELKLLRRQIDTLIARVSEIDAYRVEYKLKMENLYENIKQNYGLDIDTVEIQQVTSEDENQLTELREKVQELGPVNLGTLEEYEELRTRYEFLTKQREDLNRSIEELEEAIIKINNTTRKKLKEAYDALREKFSEVFTILFGGGKADLVITDEGNILETGLDIIAQPPGKRLQNISLLSGGEKTLTALSLLFASFLIKPTPLCVLDEADSTLDESNTEKFAKMLQGLSRDIQFIVVTHNRTTMSIADHIYGITMEEAGISKVISMQLVEA